MKRYNLIFIFLAIVLAPLMVQAQVNTGHVLQESFYKKLKGTIGTDIHITMDLFRDGNVLSGFYYYDRIGKPLYIEGTFSAPNIVDLTEIAEGESVSGQFSGTFLDVGTVEGKWVNEKTKETLPFSLMETTEGVAGLKYEHYEKVNYEISNINRRKPYSELSSPWDTVSSVVRIELLQISLDDAKIATNINAALVASVCGSMNGYYSSIDSLLNSVNKIQEGEYLDKAIVCFLLMNENNVISVMVWQSEFTGGAHPTGVQDQLSFDLLTGKQIELDDILIKDYSSPLNVIAEKKFTEEFGSEGWWFTPGQFELNGDFAITREGLRFCWDQYEIGPYVAGAPEIVIPYAEIKDLLKPQSCLSRFVK